MEIYSEDYLRGRTVAELLELRRGSERVIRMRQCEMDKLHWSNQDRDSHSQVIDNNYGAMRMIDKELDRQKAERNARNQNDLGRSLNAWFAKQEFAKPTVVDVSWILQGRQYSGRFFTDSGKLDVSIAVKPGTPGAQRRGPKYYLRCNSVEDQRAAIIAESKTDEG